MNEDKKISLDILKHLEDLSTKVNGMMEVHTKAVFVRYPLTFGLLILAGVVAVSEGIRGVMDSFVLFQEHPWYMIAAGVLILIFTGTLYKKLEEKKLE